jgi:hypothetical protein
MQATFMAIEVSRGPHVTRVAENQLKFQPHT